MKRTAGYVVISYCRRQPMLLGRDGELYYASTATLFPTLRQARQAVKRTREARKGRSFINQDSMSIRRLERFAPPDMPARCRQRRKPAFRFDDASMRSLSELADHAFTQIVLRNPETGEERVLTIPKGDPKS